MSRITIAALITLAMGLIPFVPKAHAGDASVAFKAKSWGGKVRAAPGNAAKSVATLAEMEPITILAKTTVIWNDYPWFKIQYHGKKIGYQWGGIICAVGNARDDVFQVCK